MNAGDSILIIEPDLLTRMARAKAEKGQRTVFILAEKHREPV